MKRFRLGTLMFLILIAASCFALAKQAGEMSRRHVEPEYRLVEVQRVLMIVIAASLFALAKRANEASRRGVGLDSGERICSE